MHARHLQNKKINRSIASPRGPRESRAAAYNAFMDYKLLAQQRACSSFFDFFLFLGSHLEQEPPGASTASAVCCLLRSNHDPVETRPSIDFGYFDSGYATTTTSNLVLRPTHFARSDDAPWNQTMTSSDDTLKETQVFLLLLLPSAWTITTASYYGELLWIHTHSTQCCCDLIHLVDLSPLLAPACPPP